MVRSGNTVQMNISVPREMADHIKVLAERERRSVSNWCSNALWRGIQYAESLPRLDKIKLPGEAGNDENN